MSLFRKRDFAILVTVLVTAYITLDNNSYSYLFEPAWYIDQRYSRDIPSGRTILPIIADLDGNGENEVIAVTNNYQLKVIPSCY